MPRSFKTFKVGTRDSRLAVAQTREALAKLATIAPGLFFEEVPCSSPGDRDQDTDLRASPPDFFTRDLDEALRAGTIDCAIHSAKDMPDPIPEGLDWFWLPWREDARDVLVLRKGMSRHDLTESPNIGISSERRESYCRRVFPKGRITPIRGTIESRLAQLDAGIVDIVIMAGAALLRLGLQSRITEWIPLTELAAPPGQGVLAMTFRADDLSFLRLRSLFVKSVTFVGAGVGSAGMCTSAGLDALHRCDVCLYDALLDPVLLNALPAGAERIDVGKRCGQHMMKQADITELISTMARRGHRVVRLKGGDSGIFGRLAEEIEGLEGLHLPYRVIPGVSSMSVASTGTGMLLTRRGISRGFCVMTPRQQGGCVGSIQADERKKLPLVFFMAINLIPDIVRQLIDDGMDPSCPAAVIFNAGSNHELILRGTVGTIHDVVADNSTSRPGDTDDSGGLLMVGDATRFDYIRRHGALEGRRILLTCSEELQGKAAGTVHDLGGIPLRFPLIRLVPQTDAARTIRKMDNYDWIAITSPASVRCFMDIIDREGMDLRRLPRLMACGPGSASELRKYRLQPDIVAPQNFGAAGLLDATAGQLRRGARVLRLQSDKAGHGLGDELRKRGAIVEECHLYRNETIVHDRLPVFDAVIFASGSAVDAFVSHWGPASLHGKIIVAIGPPTATIIERLGLTVDLVSPSATITDSIEALARLLMLQALAVSDSFLARESTPSVSKQCQNIRELALER